MDLLGDVGHWNLTLVRLETVLVRCKRGARFAPNVPEAEKLFWTHPMVLLGDEAQVPSFGSFGDSDNLDAR
jgi:hypothetical protein